MSRISWSTIKREYIYSDPPVTLEQLAAKHCCSLSALLKRCANDLWTEARRERDAAAESAASRKEVERRADVLQDLRITGEQAIERARTNHQVFQACVADLNLTIAEAFRKAKGDYVPEAGDIDVWIKANKADAEITAKLYGIPQVLDVSMTQHAAPADGVNAEVLALLAAQGIIVTEGAQA